jgi:hypothetical protein
MSAERWHLLSVGLATLSLLIGVLAAYYWWQASRVAIVPVWGEREPLDQTQALAGWVAGFNRAAELSGSLNKTAAILSGCAVVGSTIAGWVGTMG